MSEHTPGPWTAQTQAFRARAWIWFQPIRVVPKDGTDEEWITCALMTRFSLWMLARGGTVE